MSPMSVPHIAGVVRVQQVETVKMDIGVLKVHVDKLSFCMLGIGIHSHLRYRRCGVLLKFNIPEGMSCTSFEEILMPNSLRDGNIARRSCAWDALLL